MIVNGYRMKSSSIDDLTQKIEELHKKYQIQMKKEYGRLLGEEISFLCDQIALNVVQRPTCSVFEQARQNLNQQIQMAVHNGARIRQNVQVTFYVIQDGEYVYFNVQYLHPSIGKIFKCLEPYSLSEEEYVDEDNAKRKQWERLNEKATKTPPLGINFFEIPENTEEVKPYIKYQAKKESCAMEARHTVMNRLLNQLAGGQQIPPVLLMRFFDQMMEDLLTPDAQKEIRQRQAELLNILPDLQDDDAFIYQEGGQEHVETDLEG